MDNGSTHCFVKLFQFVGDHNINLICLPLHATLLLASLGVEIIELPANSYCVKLDNLQQAGNTNINRGDFLALFKLA